MSQPSTHWHSGGIRAPTHTAYPESPADESDESPGRPSTSAPVDPDALVDALEHVLGNTPPRARPTHELGSPFIWHQRAGSPAYTDGLSTPSSSPPPPAARTPHDVQQIGVIGGDYNGPRSRTPPSRSRLSPGSLLDESEKAVVVVTDYERVSATARVYPKEEAHALYMDVLGTAHDELVDRRPDPGEYSSWVIDRIESRVGPLKPDVADALRGKIHRNFKHLMTAKATVHVKAAWYGLVQAIDRSQPGQEAPRAPDVRPDDMSQ